MVDDKATKAQAMIKAIVDDQEAEINGRIYKYLKMTHKQRRKVFAFYSKVANRLHAEDMSFFDTPEFDKVEGIILSATTYDDSLLVKLGDRHWELYPSDYVTFITMSLSVVSFPFFPENPTDSAST